MARPKKRAVGFILGCADTLNCFDSGKDIRVAVNTLNKTIDDSLKTIADLDPGTVEESPYLFKVTIEKVGTVETKRVAALKKE